MGVGKERGEDREDRKKGKEGEEREEKRDNMYICRHAFDVFNFD